MPEDRTFGRFRCVVLSDGAVGPFPIDQIVLDEHARGDGSPYQTPMNIPVLTDGDEVVLIDAGWGPGPERGRIVAELAAIGIEPGAVNDVLITHLHGDHAAGLTREGALTFPSARVHVPPEDVAWARASGRDEATAMDMLEEAGLLRDLSALPEGIEAIPTPGHTPGHTAYRVGRGAESLIVGGDALMLDEHFADPSIKVSFDGDHDAAAASRREVLRLAAEGGSSSWYHLEPAIGRVVSDGDTWRFGA